MSQEALKVIQEFDLNYPLGCVVKYILRSGRKQDKLQDLKKALWYLNSYIDNMESEHGQMDSRSD